MKKVYIIAAKADEPDEYHKVEIGHQVYVGLDMQWTRLLNAAKWYYTREEVIAVMLSDAHRDLRNWLQNDNRTWQILELSYKYEFTDITDDERDPIIRQNALNRLTAEERKILNLS